MHARNQHVVNALYNGVIVELVVAADKAPETARNLSTLIDTQVSHISETETTVYQAGELIHTEDCSAIGPEDVL